MSLKKKVINILLLTNGNKRTSEKIFKNSLKLLQKKTKKNFCYILKKSLINTTPIFKNTEYGIKRGKRKTLKVVPQFVHKPDVRLTASLKLIDSALNQNKLNESKSFYQKLSNEILSAYVNEGNVVTQKNSYHAQSLLARRHLTHFKW